MMMMRWQDPKDLFTSKRTQIGFRVLLQAPHTAPSRPSPSLYLEENQSTSAHHDNNNQGMLRQAPLVFNDRKKAASSQAFLLQQY